MNRTHTKGDNAEVGGEKKKWVLDAICVCRAAGGHKLREAGSNGRIYMEYFMTQTESRTTCSIDGNTER